MIALWSACSPGSASKDDPFHSASPALVKEALGDRIQLRASRADVVYQHDSLNVDPDSLPDGHHKAPVKAPSSSAALEDGVEIPAGVQRGSDQHLGRTVT
jgi:hypothetical protein